LFETVAEVPAGLRKAYEDFQPAKRRGLQEGELIGNASFYNSSSTGHCSGSNASDPADGRMGVLVRRNPKVLISPGFGRRSVR
jgi:hypothetical protein